MLVPINKEFSEDPKFYGSYCGFANRIATNVDVTMSILIIAFQLEFQILCKYIVLFVKKSYTFHGLWQSYKVSHKINCVWALKDPLTLWNFSHLFTVL